MEKTDQKLALINPANGQSTFEYFNFEENPFDSLQRLNKYSILLLETGSAKLNVDFSEYTITGPSILFFSAFQPFLFSETDNLKGIALHFHSDFYCIHKHQHEIACNGVLFNNLYKPPFINFSSGQLQEVLPMMKNFEKEIREPKLAQTELLESYLKILLIYCSRLKLEQQKEAADEFTSQQQPAVLQNLQDAIEAHYRKKHSPAEYASLLNITPKALAKITKTHWNKTIGVLIGERIIVEAKRELYLSSKPVKAIAWELGFDDEYYFSRFFKKNTSVSPQLYREKVGFAKGEVA